MNERIARVLRGGAPPVLLWAAGMAIAFWPMLSSGFARMQADPGDTRHLNYVLEHGWRWLSGAPRFEDLWAPAIFFPEQGTGAYTELLLGLLGAYAALRGLGFAPDTAFQVWMLAMAAMNFLAAWAFLRFPLRCSPLAASAGAFVFAFGSARLNQLNHQHLLPQFFSIVVLHAAVRMFQAHPSGAARLARTWIALFFAALAAQLYAGVYYGWFLGFALAIATIWALALRPLRAALVSFVWTHKLALALGFTLTAAALAPMLLPYLAAARAVGYRDFDEVATMIPRAQSWFFMGGANWLYGWTVDWRTFRLPMAHEQAIGLGLVLSLVTVTTLWRERARPLAKLLALGALTVILLVTLYRGGYTPWRIVFEVVPGASALRAVSRVGILLLIPASIALAWFIDAALTRRSGAKRWAVLGAGALCLLEQAQSPGSYDKQHYRDRVATLAAQVPPECASFFFTPVGSSLGFEETQLDAMWTQLELGVPTVNGYSSNFPRDWDLLDHRIRSERDRARLEAALEIWRRTRGLEPDDVCWVELPFR